MVVEEHISLNQDPGSIYIGYVVLDVGTAKGIEIAITGFLLHNEVSQDRIVAIGCDGTNVNTEKYLPETLKKIIDPVIQRNGYFAHPEGILLAMITDDKKHVRKLVARRILKARSIAQSPTPRLFEVPLIDFNAYTYIDLINCQENLTEPPILKNLSDQEIQKIVESGGESEILFIRLPCHTQAVERAINRGEGDRGNDRRRGAGAGISRRSAGAGCQQRERQRRNRPQPQTRANQFLQAELDSNNVLRLSQYSVIPQIATLPRLLPRRHFKEQSSVKRSVVRGACLNTPPDCEIFVKKMPLSAAEKQRRYRERMKNENPEKYEQQRKKKSRQNKIKKEKGVGNVSGRERTRKTEKESLSTQK
ncbi:hypothetical protein evm_013716 [Chilo suppressalis]|nr:hypothetical protein evm_013716 [Chilo suppressalis]